MQHCPLVLIEWEDSTQPIPEWRRPTEYADLGPVRCVSVGWLIGDRPDVKTIAPNFSNVDDDGDLYASGVIQIVASSVRRITELAELEPATSSWSDAESLPASDPVDSSEQTRQ